MIWHLFLRELRAGLPNFLGEHLQLRLKQDPAINLTDQGLDFLGCRLFRSHMILSRRSRLRFHRKLAALIKLHNQERISDSERQQRETAIVAFATAGGVKSWQFRMRTLAQLPVSGYKARIG